MAIKSKKLASIESFARIISNDQYALGDVDPILREDKKFILALLRIDGLIYKSPYLPIKFRNDKEIMIAAVNQNPYVFYSLPSEWQLNKQIAFEVLKQKGDYLQKMDYSLRQDKDLVLVAMETYPYAIASASEKLQDDRDVALLAITKDPSTFRFLGKTLKDDKEMVWIAVSAGASINDASDRLRGDRELVLTAINNSRNFLIISTNLQDDKEVILAAVKKDGVSLKYASNKLKNDKEIVYAALSTTHGSLEYASKELRNDLDAVLTALYYSDRNISYVSDELLRHPSVRFILDTPGICQSDNWPIIKQALVEQYELFFNPPLIIKELSENLDNKYAIYAQHALSVEMPYTELPSELDALI